MKLIVILFMAFLLLSVLAAADSTMIVLHYDNGDVSLKKVELLQRDPARYVVEPEEGYYMEMKAFNGSVIYTRKFQFALWAYSNPQRLTVTDDMFILPYFNYMKELLIYDKSSRQLLTVDLSEYAICNQNSICNSDYGETIATCQEDCAGKEIVEEEAPLAEFAEEKAMPEKKVRTEYIAIAALAVILLLIIFLALRRKERRGI